MGKYITISTKIVIIPVFLILVNLSLFGCAGMGRIVPADNRILFTEKVSSQGIFSHAGLTVEYSYRLEGKNLALEGEINYLGGVDSLNVYLQFIDATGAVLQQEIVYYSGYRISRHWIADRSFQATLVVPPAAVGLSFSYSAQPRSNQR